MNIVCSLAALHNALACVAVQFALQVIDADPPEGTSVADYPRKGVHMHLLK